MKLIRIADARDPRVAPYRDIRERDLVGREGRFVAEGKVVVRLLLASGRFRAESALILESRMDGMTDVLKSAPADMPVYVAEAAVMDAVAGFPVHRGVLAIGLKRPPADVGELLDALPERAVVVVAAGISNHDNMGAIFRNAAAFGADAVLLDGSSCDPLYRKAIRVSVGAVLRVPFAAGGSVLAIADLLSGRGFRQIALTPRGGRDIAAIARGGRMALYLGSEGEGLPPALMARLETVRIAMAPGFDSLNVAAASAIALHRLAGKQG